MGGMHVMEWVQSELQRSGLTDTGPSLERLRVFSSAFGEVIEMLPSYRPFLVALHKEYDSLVRKLQTEFNAVAPLEGRLKTLKAESFRFVGESMTFFQMEIGNLRQRLAASEAEVVALRSEQRRLEQENAKLREVSDKDKLLSTESHQQNLDILRHLERCERQIELLRKVEKDFHLEVKSLKSASLNKDSRIATIEEQLTEERARISRMVQREDHEALREELRQSEVRYKDLEEKYAAKQTDYINIVETYSRRAGQSLNVREELRPLTPRPVWHHCRGLMDLDVVRSVEKADGLQETLQVMFLRARSLLSAYGLHGASQKSDLVRAFAKHPMALPLWSLQEPHGREDERSSLFSSRMAALATNRRMSGSVSAAPAKGREADEQRDEDDEWLQADVSEDTPRPMRHVDKVKNLRLTRRKVSELMESVLLARARQNQTSVPFIDSLLRHLRDEIGGEEHNEKVAEFAINVHVALRRHSQEPDFLAYLLLLLGRVPDTAVKDSKAFCVELLRIFTTCFDAGDSALISKTKLFHGLQEVLQNKDEKMWQALVDAFPAGGPETIVNFEWLFQDDAYILSPLVYALRMQHLEEVVTLVDRLETAVRATVVAGSPTVKYETVQQALQGDAELSLLQAEDYAKAFGVPVDELSSDTKRDVDEFLQVLRHGDLFHVLYFPILPSEDTDLGAGD